MLQDINQKPEVIEFIREFIRRPVGFMLLSGKNGTGKTYAAMTVYEAIATFKLPDYDSDVAMFMTQAELNMKFNKYAQTGDTHHLLYQLTETRLLVIDDLGTRTPSDAFMDFLYPLADKRYSDKARKGTIITTNLNADDMREKFGDAFFSRVASGQCFRFDGRDRRMDGPNTSLEPQGCIIPLDLNKQTPKNQNVREVL